MGMSKKKKSLIFAIKTIIATIISIFLAYYIGLDNYVSAGIITILSVAPTKKETVRIAMKRFVGFVVALIVAFVAFKIFGFNIYGFFAYLVVYILFCNLYSYLPATAPNSVLVSHFIGFNSFGLSYVLNECGIFIIGVCLGIIVNLTLHADVSKLEHFKEIIEKDLHDAIIVLAKIIRGGEASSDVYVFDNLERDVNEAKKFAAESVDNTFTKDLYADLRYVEMRKNQTRVINEMVRRALQLKHPTPQAETIAKYLDNLSEHMFEENDVTLNINELEELFEMMKKEEMPKKREEFEDRAILYHLLLKIRDLLEYKKEWME